MSPKIFSKFNAVTITADGNSVYDFLGGSINVEYKANWKPVSIGSKLTPRLPAPNEWYVDWLATLSAAYFADDTLQVIELGAGYAQWTVSAIHAYKSLKPSGKVYSTALEADSVHFQWMLDHSSDNLSQYTDIELTLLNKAAGADGTVSFPVLSDPASVYGASYMSPIEANANSNGFVQVESLSLKSVYSHTKKYPVDLLHVDIQGAEVDLLLNSNPQDELSLTKVVLIGTHKSDEIHNQVRKKIEGCGLQVVIDWPRNSQVNFFGNTIQTHDGALLAINPFYINIDLLSELVIEN